jgi:peptidoglycan/LPS O-acetylase OafA/YrhL
LGLSLATLGLFVISVACLIILPIYIVGTVSGTFVCLVAASLVMTSALCLEKAGWSANNQIIITLGNASYSLYLTHAFLALAAVKFFQSHGGPLWLAAVMLPITYGGSVIIAFCVYTYVERPMTRTLRSAIGDAAKSLRAREPSPSE